jgi:dienelactone hydrolase
MSLSSSAWRFVVVLAVGLGLSPLLFGFQAGLIGHWDGTMIRDGAPLEVSFDFTVSGAQLRGTFTSLTQQAMDYPLASVKADSDMVHLVLGDSLVFDGKLRQNEITGRFTDEDAKGEFTLRRTARTTLPYDSIDVTFHNGVVSLAGTLCSPRTSARHAAVVILQGSGGETRWGTNRFIADRFARKGIAALVYDKRGSGGSSGDWKSSSYDDLADDALAGIDLLASRADIDPKRIGLHGHSEGGIIAPIAAAHAPSKVAFVVAEDTVAGLVRDQDVYRVGRAIRAAGLTESEVEHAMAIYTLMLDVACGRKAYRELEIASRPVRDEKWYAWLAIPPEDSYLWSWYPRIGDLDSLIFWKQVHVPVLLVYGELDKLVPVNESLAKIEAALDTARTPYTAIIAPASQHNLTVRPEEGEPFFWWKSAPGLIDLVAAWVQQRTSEPIIVRPS